MQGVGKLVFAGYASQRQPGMGVRDHQRQSVGWIFHVQRQIGRAGLENGEQPHNQSHRARQGEGDDVTWSDAVCRQLLRQAVCAAVQLCVVELGGTMHQRDDMRCSGGLGFEKIDNGGGG
ncbi:hypothetical protein LF63_0103190 [Oleiagrimonas soli]|uniref:Uncharacterized protein n=1 Tax=Oleiagrimonas soli TaxID=1543381 RepID=A0A099CWZ7_9GAMM|nr:hypothetical protein LF63_0103190 [Oleiagrimonas soli]